MKRSLSKNPLIYCLFLTIAGISIPWVFLLFPPPNAYLSSPYDANINNLSSCGYVLFLSYALVFSYLFFTFYYPFLLIYFSSYFFPQKTAYQITKGEFYDTCFSLSSEAGIKMPHLYFSKLTDNYSFGKTPENSTIILNEYCQQLDSDCIKVLLLHEISHIKNDIRQNTLKNIYKGIIGKYELVLLIFPCILIWFLIELGRMLFASYFYGTTGSTLFFNRLFPFLVALMSVASIQAIKLFMKIFTYSITEPVSDISEFKADLFAYVKIGKTKPFSDLFHFIRKKQVAELLNNLDKPKPSFLLDTLQSVYDFLDQANVPKISHSTWMEYFKETKVTSFNYHGKSDYPLDTLRLDFIDFIDVVYNNKAVLKIKSQSEKQLFRYLEKKNSWSLYIESPTAIRDWLYEDVNKIPLEQKKEITNGIFLHKDEFNARKLSEEIDVPIIDVLVVFLYFIMLDRISVNLLK